MVGWQSHDAADLAVRRLNYAIRRGALLLRAQDLTESPQGEVGAIPDDPWCIPDQAIPD